MNKIKRYLTIGLTLIALFLIGWSLTDSSEDDVVTVDANEPTYQTQEMVTKVYNPEGQLTYILNAADVKHYLANEDTWFSKPFMTMYDQTGTATWSIRAERAKLTKKRLLYLYGDVEINSLTEDAQLKRITTDNAEINLITQDISSDDEVTLYGTNFKSNGMKMRGNLQSKSARLIDQVKSYYEIQPKNTKP